MKTSISPWIHQLKKERVIVTLKKDVDTDVVIVGAGIAGITTAFFALRNTQKKVVVVEANRLALGATGHNAGQVVSYFERPFNEMVKEFGVKKTAHGWAAIESAWGLIDMMYRESNMTIPLSRFIGHAGFSSEKQVLLFMEDLFGRLEAGLRGEELLVADDAPFTGTIPPKYNKLYRVVPRAEILSRLETANDIFVACASYQKGTLNSALFCQELVEHLLSKYKDRFSFFEETPILKVVLHKNHALLDAGKNTLKAEKVVLCTNGFENFTILDDSGLEVDTKFHKSIVPKVGYMSGYLETFNKPPAAISYFTDPDSSEEDPYFYLTRRAYEYEVGTTHNLICIGGPEKDLKDKTEYVRDYDFPEKAQKDIDDFVKTTYETDPNKKIEYKFTWHGLMGYTPNGIRLIGSEPRNRVLLYNLGCNGVGILPSIYGGMRISQILRGDKLEATMFDPKK